MAKLRRQGTCCASFNYIALQFFKILHFSDFSFCKQCVVWTANLCNMLLELIQSTTQYLDAITIVVDEISIHELRSNLAFFLSLSISKQCIVKAPDFGRKLLSVCKSTKQNLDALAVVVCEI